MIYNFEFYLHISKTSEIIFETGKSSKIIGQNLMIFSDNSRKFNKLNNELSESKKIILDSGIYHFNLNIEYSGTDWKFDPQIVKNKSKISLFKEKNIFINFDKNNFKNFHLKNNIGSIYDFLIFLLIFISF